MRHVLDSENFRKCIFAGWILLLLTAIPGCESAPKKKPIYSYELPWSGTVIHADSPMKIPGDPYDGNKRLDAYFQARKQAEQVLLQQIGVIGPVIDPIPLVMVRLLYFLTGFQQLVDQPFPLSLFQLDSMGVH